MTCKLKIVQKLGVLKLATIQQQCPTDKEKIIRGVWGRMICVTNEKNIERCKTKS